MEIERGTFTGKKDDNGRPRPIRCGDRVELHQFRPGHTKTSTYDGWGQEVPLCKHDQIKVPDQTKITVGTVNYSPEFTGFVVNFEEALLDSCKAQEWLYVLGRKLNRDKDRLLVKGRSAKVHPCDKYRANPSKKNKGGQP